MAQTYSLDRVIQKVSNGAAAPVHLSRRLVRVDVKRRRVYRRTWWPCSNIHSFLVANHIDPLNEARVKLEHLVSSDLDHRVLVTLLASVRCPPGHEETVALSLADASASPEDVLRGYAERWLAQAAADGVEAFVRRCFADRTGVERALSFAVHRDTGLEAECRLTFDVEHALASVTIDVPALAVVVADFDDEQTLGVRVELSVDRRNLPSAVLRYGEVSVLESLVTDEVRRYLRDHVSLQAFCTELDTGDARDGLLRHLNEVASAHGRHVANCALRPVVPFAFRRSVVREIPVTCTVRGYPVPVTVMSRVLLVLADLGRYRSRGAPELERWLDDTLRTVIPQVLVRARYIDVLLRPGPLVAEIKRELADAARQIGYDITQFVTVPNLVALTWVEPFTIRIEGSFPTRLPDLEAKLEVVARVRIPRLDEIESLLSRPEHDIPAQMRERIHDTLEAYLHGVDPERFYMRFTVPDPARYPNERGVETELIEQVETLLTDRFKAEVHGVFIKVLDTELVERYRALQEGFYEFAVQVAPRQGGAPVTFQGEFRVTGVADWHEFHRMKFTLPEIGLRVEAHLKAHLETHPPEAIHFLTAGGRQELETFVKAVAQVYVARTFGLTIEVASLRTDQKEFLRLAEQFDRARSDLIADLLEKRRKAALVVGNDDDVAYFDARIAELGSSSAAAYLPYATQPQPGHPREDQATDLGMEQAP